MRGLAAIGPTAALLATLTVGVSTAGARPDVRSGSRAPAKADVSAHAARRGITITTRMVGSFGRILVDGRGLPLYTFSRDRGSRSRCYGDCAAAWPVTYAQGSPRARGGASSSLLGRHRRRDGRLQVTYRGRPLYYYVRDSPGVALCHDVREFGGLWLLVRPSGRDV